MAEWFEKPIVTVYIENVWANMRSSIRALLGKISLNFFIDEDSRSSRCSGLSIGRFHPSVLDAKFGHFTHVPSASIAR